MSCDRLPSRRTASQGKIFLTSVGLNKNSLKRFSCNSACFLGQRPTSGTGTAIALHLEQEAGKDKFLYRNSLCSAEQLNVAGKTILLVEDNEADRLLAKYLLLLRQYQVYEAATAQEAFEILKTHRPDLIIMDILLPDMNGLEATKKIKENPETREIPVVAVTAYVIGGDRERALAAGCVEFIRKPIDKETFVNQITSYL